MADAPHPELVRWEVDGGEVLLHPTPQGIPDDVEYRPRRNGPGGALTIREVEAILAVMHQARTVGTLLAAEQPVRFDGPPSNDLPF